MLRGMEEMQFFLLAKPDKERELAEVLMICYSLIKMVNTILYGKAIERWNNLPASD